MRFILPIILIVAALGLFFLFTDPVYKEVKVLKAQEESFDEALGNAKQLQAVRSELDKKYNAFTVQDLEKLRKFLPDSPDNIRLVIDIETIAMPYAMYPTNIKFDIKKEAPAGEFAREETARRNYNIFDLEFSTAGPYDKFMGFLKDLEKNLRIIDVTSLAFSSAEPQYPYGEQAGIYTYDFKIRTYWFK